MTTKNPLLDATKAAYRKHHLNDDSIGWQELSEILFHALTEAMGDGEFHKWLKEVDEGGSGRKATFPEQDPKARVLLVLEDICPECGSDLDTGWECNNQDCQYDALGKEIPRSHR